MTRKLRIGTRDSQLAVWQATHVQQLLEAKGIASELIYIKSEGDLNTTTPLYEMGVTGIFTKALDQALLGGQIDIAVHSMKDVPVVLAKGIRKAAVLERASYKDILVYKHDTGFLTNESPAIIATSSIRRIAQWRHKFPNHELVSLRGNVNTRLRKLDENNWNGAIFAAAGLERIGLRPANSIDLDWMLPAPAQGAIMVVCRENDNTSFYNTSILDHKPTAICTHVEREFLRTLEGGCSTPVSALAVIENGQLQFSGNIASHNGANMLELHEQCAVDDHEDLGHNAAMKILVSNEPWVKQVLKKN
ncbi:MAG TPA: hydroxymethylbilane synthase [Chitinophagaceae bacterium]|nr:hydroxymethylbilane synthase [Chitinophagaceae bacterium]